MTIEEIEEAISLLENFKPLGNPYYVPKVIAACKLGIEALKCIKVLRSIPDKRLNLELPGETDNMVKTGENGKGRKL